MRITGSNWNTGKRLKLFQEDSYQTFNFLIMSHALKDEFMWKNGESVSIRVFQRFMNALDMFELFRSGIFAINASSSSRRSDLLLDILNLYFLIYFNDPQIFWVIEFTFVMIVGIGPTYSQFYNRMVSEFFTVPNYFPIYITNIYSKVSNLSYFKHEKRWMRSRWMENTHAQKIYNNVRILF